MRRLLILVAACSAPTRSEPKVISRPPSPPATYALPAPPPPPAWHPACDGGPSAVAAPRAPLYELAPIAIRPVRTGPRLAQRSRAGKARSWLQLDEAIARAHGKLAGCWKWAAARGAPETTLDLAFTMTPLGKTIGHSIVDPAGKSPELVACLQDNLVHLAIDEPSPRTTRMRARVAFVRANQPAWPTPPKRPSPAPPEAHTRTCVPVLDDAPVDQLASPILYTVDDFDEARNPPTRGVPVVFLGCRRFDRLQLAKVDIRTAVESNRGAFEACFADALARDPALAGIVDVHLRFVAATTPTEIAVTGPGDDAFHTCIDAATRELWMPEVAARDTLDANLHFELAPAIALPATASPRERLAAGDADAALAGYLRALAAAHDDRTRCDARAGILQAAAALAPWLDDVRVIAAAKDLTTFAASVPEPIAKGCLEPLDELLRRIAYGHRGDGTQTLRWSWLDRTEAVLPAAPRLAWGPLLRVLHAAQLAMTVAHHTAGVEALHALADTVGADVRGLVERELARYDEPHPVETRACEQLH